MKQAFQPRRPQHFRHLKSIDQNHQQKPSLQRKQKPPYQGFGRQQLVNPRRGSNPHHGGYAQLNDHGKEELTVKRLILLIAQIHGQGNDRQQKGKNKRHGKRRNIFHRTFKSDFKVSILVKQSPVSPHNSFRIHFPGLVKGFHDKIINL